MDQLMPVKKAVRLQQWNQLIQDFQSSGMKLKDWLPLNNISRDTYYYWLRKCREAVVSDLPVEIKSKLPAVEESSKTCFKALEVQSPVTNMQAAVIVRLPQATLEVTNDATQQTLEAVLLALKSVC